MDDSALPGLLGCGMGLAFFFLVSLVGLVVGLVISYLLFDAERKLPQAYQKIVPGLVFLLVVPVFNLVWIFVVVLKVSQSFQAYFASRQRAGVGDAGQAIGLAWAITAIASLLPLIGFLSAVASIVLMVLYLMKITQLKAMVVPGDATLPSPPLPPPA